MAAAVFKLAKEVGVTSKDVMTFLKEKGMPAKSAITALTQAQYDVALEHFTGAGSPKLPAPTPGVAAKAETPKAPAAAAPGTPTPPAPPKPGAAAAPAAAAPAAPAAAPTPAAPPAPRPAPPPPARRTYRYTGPVTLVELARSLDLKAAEIIKALLADKQLITLNQRVNLEVVRMIAKKFDFDVPDPAAASATATGPARAVSANQKPRAPVVTIMGHVDHGKTSLLDAIRSTDVASGEAGGITQHISAFKVRLPKGGEVVFLDTPGHEAFTALRARGAKVTDVVVLVVAADDGVMPQTIEAIDHAKAANVPIVVAVNKIDKPGANPQRVRQELAGRGLNPEEWGGKTLMVDVSARTKAGVEKLLEMLLLEAELLELKADPSGSAEGTVLEARMHKSRGPVATVLIQHGALHTGDIVTAGSASGRVRMMLDDKGHALKETGPATPIELLGLSAVPEPGAILRVVTDEREARDLAEAHLGRVNQERLRRQHITLQDVSQSVKAGETKELHLILKADVQGSLEAVSGAFGRLVNEQVKLRPIHEGVGPINASDIALAAASDAVIIGFNVTVEPQVEPLARQEGVEIRHYNIIYNAIDDLKKAMEGLLAPKVEEVALGRVEVRATFRTPRGTVAGCFVTSGKVVRGEKLRVMRGGALVREATISSLRRFKDDVREVGAGYECGLSAEGFNDFQVGDLVEVYTQTLVQEKLRL